MATSAGSHPRSDVKMAAAGGLTIFAAVMLFISGSLDFCRGLMAVLEDKVFLSTPNYVFEFDLTSWGWIHIVLGAIAVIVSFGLFVAMKWARILGVILAGLLIIANFLSIPYHPLWSLTLIAMDGFIIWALCVVQRDTLY
ncbi:hypothetical protein [Streptomyces sp. VRA16 Mangrove soil]|uniref:DUF7144 family membrane protein n=1 Tax=Streptomyces sp. VRA16 Mangrove soil TaxID=2817434 RepID=UPI001A9D3A50|nr:hypothetical protein [Streptomyces sp. VRA16 Mangrove soil]MBO1332145.1 hypothetical protein [Streptomyces sp. VRA16 Mangrove soil]